MGAIGGLLGVGGGAAGTGFASPKSADIINPATKQQADQLYGQNQTAIQNQADFLRAIQAQNGLGNQTAVYNQLSNIAAGQGPNPALAQLANATNANVANQAALMAGQRGAVANPGMIARLAAQQGSQAQQQAAGQAAALQAQQSMNAIGAMGNLANQQAAQQAGATNAYTQAAQNEQQNILNSIAQQNNANVGMQSNINNVNAQLAGDTMKGQQNLLGNIMGGIGSATNLVGKFMGGGAGGTTLPATGGAAESSMSAVAAEGGAVDDLPKAPTGPKSRVGQYFHGGAAMRQVAMAKGGAVPALVSPGERYLPPKEVEKVAKGEKAAIKAGEKIPGSAPVKGAKNSYANDIVPKTLQEGGIVLPRSVTQAKNPGKEAQKFVEAILAKQHVMPRKK